jgi:hypothetical protein
VAVRRTALISLLILIAVAGCWILLAGAASVFAWQADRISALAPGPGVPAGGVDDQAIRRALLFAQQLDPTNAGYRGQLALHLERLALQAQPRGPVETERLSEAERLQVQTAEQRPTWPLGLTSVLRTRFKLGRSGHEFTRIYRRAADLGRSEPAALRALVDLGLISWPLLDPEGRLAVQDLLRHGLQTQPHAVLERALALRQAAVVAPLIAADADLQRLYLSIRNRSASGR